MASSASAASAGSSLMSKYISQVRADLQRQRPEAREAWLKAEMDTLQLGSSHEGKPSAREVCKYLNMAVSEKKGKLTLAKFFYAVTFIVFCSNWIFGSGAQCWLAHKVSAF